MTNKDAMEALDVLSSKIDGCQTAKETIRKALELNQELVEALKRISRKSDINIINFNYNVTEKFSLLNQILIDTKDTASKALAKAEAMAGGVCKSCGGDGIERCDNPDHGLLGAISFRGADESQCPCCGHDEKYRMKHWDADVKAYVWNKCPDCSNNI